MSSRKPKVGQSSDQLIGTKTDLFSRRLKKIGVRIHTALVISSNILLRVKKSRYESYGIVYTVYISSFEGNVWSIFKALIGQSVACKQKVKHVCSINSLTNLSSWTGRNGVKHTYWSGDRNPTDKGIGSSLNELKAYILWQYDSHITWVIWYDSYQIGQFLRDYPNEGCQCSLDGNCNRPPYLNSDPICNCDTMFPRAIDEGYLSQKETLPVMKLSYGGSYSQHSSIQYILGPLICTGRFDMKIGWLITYSV